MQFTPARCGRRLSYDGEAEVLRRLAPRSPDRVQPPYEHLRCVHVAPPARQRPRDGVAGSSGRREPGGATSTRHLGECKVCLAFFCSATGETQTCRQGTTTFDDLSGRPWATAWPCAVTLGTYTSYFCSHSRAFYVSSTIRAIGENKLSFVMYIIHLHSASFILIVSQKQLDPGHDRSWGGAIRPLVLYGSHPALRHVEVSRAVLSPELLKSLRTLRGLEHRLALRARREPGFHSHPRV
jgi:hypothetical protein